MIVGIGLDLVTVSRIASWLDEPQLCARFFHSVEMEFVCSSKANAAWSLAARFAAKEAFAKALGTGFTGLRLRDIRVESEPSGRPRLVLEGSAKEKTAQLGVDRVHLSLTHEGDLAGAQVILEALDA